MMKIFLMQILMMKVSSSAQSIVDSEKDFKKPSPPKVSQIVDKTPPKSTEKVKQKTPAKSDDSSEIIDVKLVVK